MSNIVFFVSEVKLKSFTAIHYNVEPTDLMPYLAQVQDIHLQEVLGSNFYGTLKLEIINNVVTTANTALIDDFIAPFMLNATIYQYLPWSYAKLMNKGIISGASEPTNSKPIDLTDLKYLRDNARSTMEFYRERLRKELVINSAKYPDYTNYATQQNLPPGRRSDYSMGISIPRKGSKVMNQNFGSGINPNDPLGGINPSTTCTDCDQDPSFPYNA